MNEVGGEEKGHAAQQVVSWLKWHTFSWSAAGCWFRSQFFSRRLFCLVMFVNKVRHNNIGVAIENILIIVIKRMPLLLLLRQQLRSRFLQFWYQFNEHKNARCGDKKTRVYEARRRRSLGNKRTSRNSMNLCCEWSHPRMRWMKRNKGHQEKLL